jgi:hypothetical protein
MWELAEEEAEPEDEEPEDEDRVEGRIRAESMCFPWLSFVGRVAFFVVGGASGLGRPDSCLRILTTAATEGLNFLHEVL